MSLAMYAASIQDDIVQQKRKSFNKTQRQKVNSMIETLQNASNNDSSTDMGDFRPLPPPESALLAGGSPVQVSSEPPPPPNRYGMVPPIFSDDDSSVLLKKVNYMISLLETQQDEKTGNVTEEIVLYFFLGIFIIFIVDSFVRVGKYIR
jgi:hypothetical protein